MIKGVVIAIVATLFVATGLFMLQGNDDEQVNNPSQAVRESSQNEANSPTLQGEEEQQVAKGAYIPYSSNILADTVDTERVLFFHAPWCSVCNFHDGEIEKNGVPEGITVIKVDYDTEEALKEQYGVTVQSTFVWLNEDGSVRQTWPFANGLRSPEDLYSAVQAG